VFIDFDENGDGVLTLDEFKELIKSLEGNMPIDKIIQLFNEALDSSENEVAPEVD
jgi:Ca2+-binding EF-hand superfamily protein